MFSAYTLRYSRCIYKRRTRKKKGEWVITGKHDEIFPQIQNSASANVQQLSGLLIQGVIIPFYIFRLKTR
jgi:hypothetical protein